MKHTNFSQMDIVSPQAEPVIQVREIHTPVVIERTAKIYKFGMLIGLGMMILGVALTAYSLYQFTHNFGRIPNSFAEFFNEHKAVYVSLSGIVLGFCIYRFEKFLAWWNNG